MIKNIIFVSLILVCCFGIAGCGFRCISETDYANFEGEREYRSGNKSKLRVLIYSENQANNILSGKKSATPEDKKKAEDLIRDLKVVNDSLPEDRKILTPGGRLIRLMYTPPGPSVITEQEKVMLSIINGSTLKQDATADAAIIRLGLLMSDLRDNFDLSKSPYQPY